MVDRDLTPRPLRVRWLGQVNYADALQLQRGVFASTDNYLLLLEHPHVYTKGVRTDPANILATVGATPVVEANRGGDVTYHGPGQLVGYPILAVPGKRGGGMADTVAYVESVEQLVIDTLAKFGLTSVGRLRGFPGVWVDPESDKPRKIAAVGVRLSRGRSMHGFALNVDPDLSYFDNIVPCGIADGAVTSLAAEGVDADMRSVVDTLAALADEQWGSSEPIDRSDVVWRHRIEDLSLFSRGEGPGEAAGTAANPHVDANAQALPDSLDQPVQPVQLVPPAPPLPTAGTSVRLQSRLDEAGITEGLQISSRKPEWMRVKAEMGDDYRRLKGVMRDLNLVTVCEEAGCPNIYDCWSDGTATFMINGERCTRACGFCLVDTRKPEEPDPAEPGNVAEAVERMGLDFAVLTTVARDDLADGGAQGFADTIDAIRTRTPGVGVEVLISDCKGVPESLDIIFDAKPDVLNHNIETVARLQRMARPSASYARSLAVLSRAKQAGLTTKSSIIVGMGETFEEVVQTMTDLRAVGLDIVTIGQYLRPTSHHVPVARWVTPDEFAEWKRIGETELGLSHVESSPLTRSSYHAKQAANAAK